MYPPPYKGTVWYYEKADTELIRRAIDQFYWLKVLSKVNIEEKVWYVTNSLFNIIHKFIPHETVVSDDKDLSWINKVIKKLMAEDNKTDKSYCHFNRKAFPFKNI